MSRHKLLILIAVVLVSPRFSFAQDTGETALKTKAYDLLETLSTQISTLQSAENRARIGSNIAWSLWPHDEKRARTLFVTVGQDIRYGLQPRENDDTQDVNTFNVFLQLRTDTIDRIAKYDPEFAFDFLKTTEPPAGVPGRIQERETAVALRLAKQIADANPEIALRLGRRVLAQGLSEELVTLLRPLLRKHREQGVTLHKEIVAKLRNAKLTDNYRNMSFAIALARVTPPLADETVFAELNNILVTAARSVKCDREHSEESPSIYFCNLIAPLMGRGANLALRVSDSELRPWAEVEAELDELAEAADFDGLLKLAETYPSMKSTIYWRAFELARTTGDLERGQKIAAAFDGTPEQKQRMLADIERAKDAAPLSETEIDEINRQLASLTEVRQRFDFLVNTSIRVGANNRALSLKLLAQLAELVETHRQGNIGTPMLVAVAVLYCMEKSDRGFTMMEAQMPKLNELIDAAVKLDGLDTHYVRDGEWNMSSNGDLGRILTWLSSNAPHFAWCDFDRAVNLAAQFERTEIRMMAQLKLAQGILAGPPKRIRNSWGRF